MNNEKFCIALVGCGGMASSYMHRYTQIEGAELSVVIDVNEEIAKEAAATLGVEHWSTDFSEALAEHIDMVDISTPNHLHCSQAVAALEAGKHVILQKPIAPSIAEAEAIVNAGIRSNRQVGMYMSMHDNPLYKELFDIIHSGAFGKISSIHCRSSHRGGLYTKKNSWRSSLTMTGGGSFIQLALHPLNMIQHLLGSKVESVSAFSKNIMCPNIGGDDVTTAICEYENGVVGTIESSYCAEGLRLSIYGSKGNIDIHDESRVFMKLDEPYKGNLLNYPDAGVLKTYEGLFSEFLQFKKENPNDQHIAFVKAMLNGESAPIKADVGLYDLKVVKAVYKSAELGRKVFV